MDSTTSTIARDNLIGGPFPMVKGVRTIGASQTLPRGAVLAIKTVGGQAFLVDKSKSDGTQTAECILLEDATTGAGETKNVPVALTGQVQSQALSYATGTALADVKATLRAIGIFVENTLEGENVVGD